MSLCYYTYIVQCIDGTYYTGSTGDLQKRVNAHNQLKSGAKYTRARRPVVLVYYEEHETYAYACKRERQIKQLTRNKKEQLISSSKVGN